MIGRQRTGGGILRTAILIAATMTTALTAGIFVDWSIAIMPGLSNVDDRTFVEAFRALDTAITNPLFLGVGFMGSLLLIGLSAALHLRRQQWPVLLWIGAALACYLLAVVITLGVHEPLNQELREAAEPTGGAEFTAARALLDEAKWSLWNTVRAIASTVAFGCLIAAVLNGRRVAGRRALLPARLPQWAVVDWATVSC